MSDEAMADAPPTEVSSSDQTTTTEKPAKQAIYYEQYDPAAEAVLLPAIRALIGRDLSEPYSIYVYRYFLYAWPHLCFLAFDAPAPSLSKDDALTPSDDANSKRTLLAAIICKQEPHRSGPDRGYIAMLATRASHRGKGIASALVERAVRAMAAAGADEVALETEVANAPSLALYGRAGFVRCKRLARYYLNGSEAFRLVLYLKEGVAGIPTKAPEWGDEPGAGQREDEEDVL